jgi:hypothetical protein
VRFGFCVGTGHVPHVIQAGLQPVTQDIVGHRYQNPLIGFPMTLRHSLGSRWKALRCFTVYDKLINSQVNIYNYYIQCCLDLDLGVVILISPMSRVDNRVSNALSAKIDLRPYRICLARPNCLDLHSAFFLCILPESGRGA